MHDVCLKSIQVIDGFWNVGSSMYRAGSLPDFPGPSTLTDYVSSVP